MAGNLKEIDMSVGWKQLWLAPAKAGGPLFAKHFQPKHVWCDRCRRLTDIHFTTSMQCDLCIDASIHHKGTRVGQGLAKN